MKSPQYQQILVISGTSGKAEGIIPHDGNAHHLDCDHSTTSVSYPEGSTNGNVNYEVSSTLGIEPPHIAREKTLADFMRDHLPPRIQVIPQEEEDTVVILNDQSELIRWLGQIRPLKCAHYVYGSMTRQLWKGKQILMYKSSFEQTLEAKRAFEIWSASVRVKFEHYHANNGWFAGKNCIIEKRIRGLTKSARRQLLHAQSRWPEEIITNLWPYLLRTAVESVQAHLKDNHPFGCQVFGLHTRLQKKSQGSNF
eukprot:12667456-Ditylum_brightwellii.AAC.1